VCSSDLNATNFSWQHHFAKPSKKGACLSTN